MIAKATKRYQKSATTRQSKHNPERCTYAFRYKGLRAPKCNGGDPCASCRARWANSATNPANKKSAYPLGVDTVSKMVEAMEEEKRNWSIRDHFTGSTAVRTVAAGVGDGAAIAVRAGRYAFHNINCTSRTAAEAVIKFYAMRAALASIKIETVEPR